MTRLKEDDTIRKFHNNNKAKTKTMLIEKRGVKAKENFGIFAFTTLGLCVAIS